MSLREQDYKPYQHIGKERTMTSSNVRRAFFIITSMMMLWGVVILTGLISS